MKGLRMRSPESSVEERRGGGTGVVMRQEVMTANAAGESEHAAEVRRQACTSQWQGDVD